MPPRYWLSTSHPLTVLLRPVAWALRFLVRWRRKLYDWGVLKTHRLPTPVVVVGNVIAGGAGKTPVVIALVQRLQRMGLRPGVVSRGYGRRSKDCQFVSPTSNPAQVGDEPVLIARTCQVPIAVATNRVQAAQALLAAHPKCNVIVSDDGLQHLALGRDMEIVLFDERGVGNHLLLPAGPLREPWPRKPYCATHVVLSNVTRRLADYALDASGAQHPWGELHQRQLHAVAGIAKPESFFQMLRDEGLDVASTSAYPDHSDFAKPDLGERIKSLLTVEPSALWLCTEKDAVKLWELHPLFASYIWALPLTIELDATFLSVFDATIQALTQTQLSS